ncbi:trypsin-like serine peptidase [Kutzneria kofuensis]|uniref:Peptidase n=1 Tax=Kutzneria kofuensis TaxID=103725 RepID=A0A7W9KS33_9PSEU|nr:hypothetical protein [Kutzneria kofuensis]MBB5897718.1 hypothetical protein [Kutzneria kofuensis]
MKLSAFGAAAAAALLGTALTAAGASAATGGDVVSGAAGLSPDVAATAHGSGVDAHEQALAAYWTPDRMRQARPESEIPAVQNRTGTVSAAPTGPAGPAGQVAAAAPKAEPKAASGGGSPDVAPAAYYPNYPVGHPVARTYGKVFFTSFGLNYVCSATIVNTEGKSEVWTAGHCVSDGQAWNSNWTFVPNYASGSAPYGYWYAYQLWTTTAWFNNNNDFANDVGSAVLYRTNGWRITDYLGGQGIAWNYPIGQYVYAFGYPQAAPFDGCCLVGENGPTYNGGGNTIYMVNYMTGGSSGGAWLMSFDGNWGYINGHNDFKYNASPQYMYSPYYGNQVLSLYNTVRNIST